MANQDSPNGLTFVRGMYGASEPRIRHFTIDSGVSGTIGRGQPCKLSTSTGHIVELDGTFANDSGDANGTGIFIAQGKCVAGDTGVPFVQAAGAIFEIQADDDWAPANQAAVEAIIGTGHCYDFSGSSHSALSSDGLSRSIAELDGNFTAVDESYMMIVDWSKNPRNEFGPFQKLHVRFHPALFARSIDHVMLHQA